MAGRWPQARERLETQREEQEAVLTKELPVGPLGSRDLYSGLLACRTVRKETCLEPPHFGVICHCSSGKSMY